MLIVLARCFFEKLFAELKKLYISNKLTLSEIMINHTEKPKVERFQEYAFQK